METTPTSSSAPVLKDTTFTKMFVGGLPYHTTDQSLSEYFSKFGPIEEAVVITDRQSGKSKGYGFVTMVNKGDAERAYDDPNPIIDGRKANVNLAYLGAKPRNHLLTSYPYVVPGLNAQQLPIGQQYSLPPFQYMLTPQGGYVQVPTAYNPQAATTALTANSTAAAAAAASASLTQNQVLDYASIGYPAAAAAQLQQANSTALEAQQALISGRYAAPNAANPAAYYAQANQLLARSAPQFQQQLQDRMQ